jgi:hypothetical protein
MEPRITDELENQPPPAKRLSLDSIDFDNKEEREALLRQVFEAGNAIALAERRK